MKGLDEIKSEFEKVDKPEYKYTHFGYDPGSFYVYFPDIFIRSLIARVEKLEDALSELRELAYYDDIRDSFEVTLACDKALEDDER